MTNMFKFNYSF